MFGGGDHEFRIIVQRTKFSIKNFLTFTQETFNGKLLFFTVNHLEISLNHTKYSFEEVLSNRYRPTSLKNNFNRRLPGNFLKFLRTTFLQNSASLNGLNTHA